MALAAPTFAAGECGDRFSPGLRGGWFNVRLLGGLDFDDYAGESCFGVVWEGMNDG